MLLDKKNKYVIGFDLGIEYSQVSYCRLDQSMPETFSMVNGEEQFNIDTKLNYKENRWFAQDVPIGQFIRKTLSLMSNFFRIEDIAAIAFNLYQTDTSLMDELEQAVLDLRIKKCKVFFMTNQDSFFQYMIHQPEEMWLHDVVLFDYRKEGITSFQMQVNRRTRPQVCYILEDFQEDTKIEDLSKLLPEEKTSFYNKMDVKLLEIAQKQCERRPVSSIFLLGDIFSKDWCKQSLKYLCRGRRVFQGNNLFSKGACYGAREKMMPSSISDTIVFLSEDKLMANLGIYCIKDNEEVYVPLLNAGEHWFEAKKDIDLILAKENKLSINVTPVDGGQTKRVEMTLDGLHVRGNKTNRIGFSVSMRDAKTVDLTIVDKGFGDFYASTGQVWKESFEL